MSDVEYDPALVQWMRENREPCALTKPELAAALAAVVDMAVPAAIAGALPDALSDGQTEALANLIISTRSDAEEA
jgi:hypothetical protein